MNKEAKLISLIPRSLFTAGARKRVPDFALVERFGEILNVPAAYFFAVTEDEAQLLIKLHRLDKKQRAQFMELVNGF